MLTTLLRRIGRARTSPPPRVVNAVHATWTSAPRSRHDDIGDGDDEIRDAAAAAAAAARGAAGGDAAVTARWSCAVRPSYVTAAGTGVAPGHGTPPCRPRDRWRLRAGTGGVGHRSTR